jgi:hypothetical protein
MASLSTNFTSDFKITRIMNAVVAGTTAQTSSAVYMGGPDGHDNVAFLVSFDVLTSGAVTSFKVQQSADDASTDTYDDLAGSSQSIADTGSNGFAVIEIVRPEKPYLKVVLTRGTQNAVINGIWAFQWKSGAHPPVQPAGYLSSLILVTPPEGTA